MLYFLPFNHCPLHSSSQLSSQLDHNCFGLLTPFPLHWLYNLWNFTFQTPNNFPDSWGFSQSAHSLGVIPPLLPEAVHSNVFFSFLSFLLFSYTDLVLLNSDRPIHFDIHTQSFSCRDFSLCSTPSLQLDQGSPKLGYPSDRSIKYSMKGSVF